MGQNSFLKYHNPLRINIPAKDDITIFQSSVTVTGAAITAARPQITTTLATVNVNEYYSLRGIGGGNAVLELLSQGAAGGSGNLPYGIATVAGTTPTTTDYIVASLTPAPPSVTNGTLIEIRFAATNNGASTISVAGFPANLPIVDQDGSAIEPNDIVANTIYQLLYDQTNARLELIDVSEVNYDIRNVITNKIIPVGQTITIGSGQTALVLGDLNVQGSIINDGLLVITGQVTNFGNITGTGQTYVLGGSSSENDVIVIGQDGAIKASPMQVFSDLAGDPNNYGAVKTDVFTPAESALVTENNTFWFEENAGQTWLVRRDSLGNLTRVELTI